MKIAVIGLGYVGFTAACCLAQQGHDVTGVDIDAGKIADIDAGRPPFEEPGLAALMDAAQSAGRLRATGSEALALRDAEVAIVCVGTPPGPDGGHDMRHIVKVTRTIARTLREKPDPAGDATVPLTLTYRSTLRPGTMRHLVSAILEQELGPGWRDRVTLAYNPEYLREAHAIHDYFHPAKIVIGTEGGAPCPAVSALYSGIQAPVFETPFEAAELTKFVDNAWHATKVAFANEIGRICEKLGISARTMHEIFVADTNLNLSATYTRPGGAFGGSCLPKDVRALQKLSGDAGAHTHLLDSLLRSNEAHKCHQFDRIMARLPSGGGRVLMAGLAFKPGTDDLRESPNVDLARKLLEAGVKVRVHDRNLRPERLRGQNLGYVYGALPTIDQLLIDAEGAETEPWDLVVLAHAEEAAEAGAAPRFDGTPVYSTDVIQ